MPPPPAPDLAVDRVAESVLRVVERVSPDGVPLASRTLHRLPPDRWALEWRLPWWVGAAFGLTPQQAEALTVSNVLGLLALRLEDDLRDGELEAGDLTAAARVMPRLLDAALAPWRAELPASSPFWSFVATALADWRSAQSSAGPLVQDLVSRAAPVRIPAYGVCLLTGRSDTWPTLDQCLGHALAALVRYDQLLDWEEDLAGGRWNGFVAAWSPGLQDPADRTRHTARIRVALLTASAAAVEYDRIGAEARAAADLAARLGIETLAGYLAGYAARTADQGQVVQTHYDRVAAQAVEQLFGKMARA